MFIKQELGLSFIPIVFISIYFQFIFCLLYFSLSKEVGLF